MWTPHRKPVRSITKSPCTATTGYRLTRTYEAANFRRIPSTPFLITIEPAGGSRVLLRRGGWCLVHDLISGSKVLIVAVSTSMKKVGARVAITPIRSQYPKERSYWYVRTEHA